MPDQASAAEKSRIGCQLGRYSLEALLGRGAFGSVYRARDTRLGRAVAIKVLERIGPRDRERFLREARALSSLQHPNLVTVHDVGDADGVLFMVLELVDGRPLADWCEPRRLRPVAEAARLVAQAARALDAAHRRGVLHRDVKPENVLVEAGQARVVDFGLAFLIDRSVQRLSQTGAWVGSPAYMAPEQAGGGEPDARTDVYGLGATLYHALCGHLPLEGADESHPAVAVHRYVPRPPSTIRPEVPPALDAICARCLAKEPGERFPDAAALALALERLESPAPSPSGGRRAWIGVGVALAVGCVAAWVSQPSSSAAQVDVLLAQARAGVGRRADAPPSIPTAPRGSWRAPSCSAVTSPPRPRWPSRRWRSTPRCTRRG